MKPSFGFFKSTDNVGSLCSIEFQFALRFARLLNRIERATQRTVTIRGCLGCARRRSLMLAGAANAALQPAPARLHR